MSLNRTPYTFGIQLTAKHLLYVKSYRCAQKMDIKNKKSKIKPCFQQCFQRQLLKNSKQHRFINNNVLPVYEILPDIRAIFHTSLVPNSTLYLQNTRTRKGSFNKILLPILSFSSSYCALRLFIVNLETFKLKKETTWYFNSDLILSVEAFSIFRIVNQTFPIALWNMAENIGEQRWQTEIEIPWWIIISKFTCRNFISKIGWESTPSLSL